MKKIFPVAALFISGLGAGIIIIALFGFRDKEKPASVKTENNFTWAPPPLPASIDFAGEAAPLDRWEIKEQLDREILFNYYWQNNILYILKLSYRYFPMIEERLKAKGIPDDFKYLCVAESNLANATSRVGAVGFWQFMKGTAPGYNMEVSETVDERYHVLKSTDAACDYLKQAYAKFGSWTAAAASYNCGMGGYQGHASFQGTKHYYDLLLAEETQRYIFRILAFKYLMENARELGFNIPDSTRYMPVKTRVIRVTNSIPDLAAFARTNGTNYKMLKWFNPWLRARSLKARPGKAYEIVLPN